MSATYSCEQIVEAVRKNEQLQAISVLESDISLPVPVRKNGRMMLSFFSYGASIARLKILPPFACTFVDVNSIEQIEVIPVEPQYFGLNQQRHEPIGDQQIQPGIGCDEYNSLLHVYYQAIDHIIENKAYLKPIDQITKSERDELQKLQKAFKRLEQSCLIPVYRVFNPEFFGWLNLATNIRLSVD